MALLAAVVIVYLRNELHDITLCQTSTSIEHALVTVQSTHSYSR